MSGWLGGSGCGGPAGCCWVWCCVIVLRGCVAAGMHIYLSALSALAGHKSFSAFEKKMIGNRYKERVKSIKGYRKQVLTVLTDE